MCPRGEGEVLVVPANHSRRSLLRSQIAHVASLSEEPKKDEFAANPRQPSARTRRSEGDRLNFGQTLRALRTRSGKSRYRLAQYSGLDQGYIQRLEAGERSNPSRDAVLMIGFALVENSSTVSLHDVDELLLAAAYAPLRRRGERLVPAGA